MTTLSKHEGDFCMVEVIEPHRQGGRLGQAKLSTWTESETLPTTRHQMTKSNCDAESVANDEVRRGEKVVSAKEQGSPGLGTPRISALRPERAAAVSRTCLIPPTDIVVDISHR